MSLSPIYSEDTKLISPDTVHRTTVSERLRKTRTWETILFSHTTFPSIPFPDPHGRPIDVGSRSQVARSSELMTVVDVLI